MASSKQSGPRYGRIRTASELGELCRQERKRRGLTLADVYETTDLSTRFLSEFERGKEHASIGRALRTLESLGLDVLVVPRGEADRILRGRAAGVETALSELASGDRTHAIDPSEPE